MSRWFGTSCQLSLTYKTGTTRPQQSEEKVIKKVLGETISYGKLNDYSELCRFLHLQKHEFYSVCVNPDSAVLKCIDFLKDRSMKGCTDLISIVEYEVPQPGDQLVYGNHYIIACDQCSMSELPLPLLRARWPINEPIRSYPCVVLKNYVDQTEDKLECIFQEVSSDNLRDTIELGLFVRPGFRNKVSDAEFNKQVFNLRVGDLAKDLLRSIRQFFGLRLDYEKEFTNEADVNSTITRIFHLSRNLKVVTSASCVRRIMLDLNDTLIDFVSIYYNYLHDVHTGSKKVINLDRVYADLEAVSIRVKLERERCAHNKEIAEEMRLTLQYPWFSRLTVPAKPRLTILIIGRSNENNSTLIDSLTCDKTTERTKTRVIVDYGSYDVELASVVPDTTPLDLNLYPVVHGFFFVFENNVSPIPFIAENDLRNLLEIVPRSAARNCCIINCFTPNASLTLSEASNQLSNFIDAFCKVHELKDRISHFCIDKNAVLDHQEHALPDDASNLIKSKIEDFILPVANSPVTNNDLKIVECLNSMIDTYNEESIELDNIIVRLKASIADRTMSDTALLFRKYLKTALPLADNEWKTAVNCEIDGDLSDVFVKIRDYMRGNGTVAIEKLKSTSIFDMTTGFNEQTAQLTGNITDCTDEILEESTPSTASQFPNSVCTQTNKSGEQSTTRTSTTLPKNVLIIGTSAPNKQVLLSYIAVGITFQDSDEYVMDYGTHNICYISRDELGTEEFDIHGCIIVVENNTMELSNSTDNHIRNTFSRLPRRAVDNCCVVNTFTPSETFGINDAEQQMRELVTKFCDQHALANGPAFICVDTTSIEAILNHNVPADPSVYQSAYAVGKRGIEQFLVTIQTAQPITPGDLENSANWARLCDAFRSHRTCRDPEVLRLMATIAENCLTGFAIYCRKNKGDALPLRGDEWPAALSYWSPKDANIAATLHTLEQP